MASKRAALMTWWHYRNFGTALQSRALVEIIRREGYECDLIDYRPTGSMRVLSNTRFSNYVQSVARRLLQPQLQCVSDEEAEKKYQSYFDDFATFTMPCPLSSSLYNLNRTYDAFVCGSDQIWTPLHFDPKYFLDFVSEKEKMIAYAPSIGLDRIADNDISGEMRKYINRFDHLSIREQRGSELIEELCGKKAEVVLDPTLLLSAEDWNEMVGMPEVKEDEPYIFCYFLNDRPDTWKHVESISQHTGMKIKIAPTFTKDYSRSYEVISGMGPIEFLTAVKHANLVCTDSYHGTIFSILYKKPLLVYERFKNFDLESQNSRIYHLLDITNLRNRLVLNKHSIPESLFRTDYIEAHKNIEAMRERSIAFLRESLQEATAQPLPAYVKQITNNCCGCGVCAASCPTKAINVDLNKYGFYQASVTHDKCINCKLCLKLCPFLSPAGKDIDRSSDHLYSMWSTRDGVRNVSSSGGVAHELSVWGIGQGYDVVGCAYDAHTRRAVHQRVTPEKPEMISAFQGSKYIQSETTGIFADILECSDKAIVFGTPCQIAGLDRALRHQKRREEFILVDLICHGVPSLLVWRKYLTRFDRRTTGIYQVSFRDKTKSWRKKHMRIVSEDRRVDYTCSEDKDLFYKYFLADNCFMDSCYECAYRTRSAADLRLGDYWGPRFVENRKGVSMVLTMTDQGKRLMEQLTEQGRFSKDEFDCNEYWSVQYPANPLKPVFYDHLLENISNAHISLSKLARTYCRAPEYRLPHWLFKATNPLRYIVKKLLLKY